MVDLVMVDEESEDSGSGRRGESGVVERGEERVRVKRVRRVQIWGFIFVFGVEGEEEEVRGSVC